MNQLNSTAIAGAAVAALSTWAFLQFPGLFIWAAFIGWAAFAHSGGTLDVLPKVVSALMAGVMIAWVVAMIVSINPAEFPVPILAGMLVGISAAGIIWVSTVPILSIVPAVFYGFAASFAFLTLTPSAFSSEAMTSFSLNNVVISVGLSLVIGAVLGQIHAGLAGKLTTSE